jgi:ABC-2 type transport system permease protein
MIRLLRDEWRRLRPVSRLLLIAGPLVLAALIQGVYLRGLLLDLPSAVVDNDHSVLSRQVTRMIDAHRYLAVTEECASTDEAFSLLRQHRIFMVAVIPTGFERDVLHGDKGRIQVTHFGANMMIGKTVMKSLTEITATIDAQRAAAGLMAMRGESAYTKDQSPAFTVVYHSLFNPAYNYEWMLPAGVIITLWQMFLVLWMINAGMGWLRNRESERILPGLSARLLLPGIVMTLQWIVFFYVLCPIFGAPVHGGFVHGFGDWLLFLGSCELLGLGAILVTCQTLPASVFAMSITAPAFAFSGYTYPFTQMPWPHQVFALLMPSTHYLPALTGWFYQGSAWGLTFRPDLLIYFVIALIVTTAAAVWRNRGGNHA